MVYTNGISHHYLKGTVTDFGLSAILLNLPAIFRLTLISLQRQITFYQCVMVRELGSIVFYRKKGFEPSSFGDDGSTNVFVLLLV